MLKRSADRKVTNLVTAGGNVAIKNTFGLPAGSAFSCPGMTSFCESICYASRTEKQYKGVSKVVIENFQTILYADYLDGVEGMYVELSHMILDFVRDCEKRNAPKRFRIHWDGDFFSVDYAKAWAKVIKAWPQVDFWVYTRSFTDDCNVVPVLAGIPNLTLYLSSDPRNTELAQSVAREYNLPIASVADTFDEARAMLFGKAYSCPEGVRLPLITDKGSACNRCGVCIEGRGSVAFSKTKR